MPNLVSKLTVQLIDQFSGPAKGAAKSGTNLADVLKGLEKSAGKGFGKFQKTTQQVVKDLTALEAIGDFKSLKRGLTDASLAYRRATQEANRMAAAIAASGTATKAQEAALKRAQNEVARTKAAFMAQGQAVRSSMSSLNAAGVTINSLASAEARLKTNIEGANRALAQQAARAATVARRKEALGYAGAAAGVYAGQKAKEIGGKAVLSAVDYDYAVRRQRAFAGLTAKDQESVLGPQARRIATDTKFSNVDVVEAQTTVANRLAEGLKSGDVIAPIIDQVKNYALAMKNVDMDMSAEAVTGYLLSTGKDICSKEKASSAAQRATNMLLRMSKLGGMSHDDLMPFVQRGASAGHIAGLSDETMGALAIAMRRSNISGDQSGTALRTLAAKLVAPTQKGQAALATAGIDYDSFTKMPGAGLSVDNLEKKFKQDFGKSFTPAIREKLQESLSDPEIVGNRGAFTQAVTEAVADLFGKNKNGKMAAADAQKIAKKTGEFHKFSVENVDAEGLLNAILAKDPSLGILNAFATDKHGNKIGLLAKAFEQFQKDRETLRNTPGDFGDKISTEITGGLGGAFERLKGSVENLILSIGNANEKLLTPAFDKIGNAIDAIASLPEPARQAGTALGALAAAALTIGGSWKIISGILGIGGPSVALNGSAAALTQSAAALNLAAVRLGAGGSIPGGTGGAPGGSPAKGGFWSRVGRIGGMIGRAGLWGGVGYGIYQGGKVIGDANRAGYANVQPGQQHDTGRMMRRRANQALYDSHRVPVINQTGAKAEDRDGSVSVDMTNIKKAEAEAKTAGASIESALTVSAKPNVDTSSIDEAQRKAEQLKATLAGIGAAARSAATSVSRAYADFGVKE